jgi:guanylate kinase
MISGNLFVVTAASGTGKTSLVANLLAAEPTLRLSVSYTTRLPRTGETHGDAYFFVTRDEFLAMRDRGEFLEWAEVHGNFYGTSKRWIEQTLNSGHDVLLEIDWQGARAVRKLFAEALIGVFILPPSPQALRERLIKRGKDSPEVIDRRLAGAREEISHVFDFEYIIVNDSFEKAARELQAVIAAARLARRPQRSRVLNILETFDINA